MIRHTLYLLIRIKLNVNVLLKQFAQHWLSLYTVVHKNVLYLFLDPETGPQWLRTLFSLLLLLSYFRSNKTF